MHLLIPRSKHEAKAKINLENLAMPKFGTWGGSDHMTPIPKFYIRYKNCKNPSWDDYTEEEEGESLHYPLEHFKVKKMGVWAYIVCVVGLWILPDQKAVGNSGHDLLRRLLVLNEQVWQSQERGCHRQHQNAPNPRHFGFHRKTHTTCFRTPTEENHTITSPHLTTSAIAQYHPKHCMHLGIFTKCKLCSAWPWNSLLTHS